MIKFYTVDVISVIVVIIVIAYFQVSSFRKTYFQTKKFKNIFAEKSDNYKLEYAGTYDTISGIKTNHSSNILKVIFESINNYLFNNKGAVSDFHLMKDIVDRNCDAKEEEIYSEIPVPIYLGLAGTMIGILFGVAYLVFSGGLIDLIDSTNSSGVNSIQGLLGGVALAMVSSIIGIVLNIWGSHLAKKAKTEVEKNKNTFLSWMQAELLPNISSDTSGALVRMTDNLTSFNKLFSVNTTNLGNTFSKVNESYKDQASLMRAIQDLKITDITTANIKVYDKLKNSTDEIGIFAEYLENANKYLSTIEALYLKLDSYEERTQIIESAGKFFAKNELWLAENMDNASLEVKRAIESFGRNTEDYLLKLKDSLNGQILSFDEIIKEQQRRLSTSLDTTSDIVALSLSKTQQILEDGIVKQQKSFEHGFKIQQETMLLAIENQQKLFEGKFQESSVIIDEIRNLRHIKEGINGFKEATIEQNKKIDALAAEIRNLVKSKSSNFKTQNGNSSGEPTGNGSLNNYTGKKRSFTRRFGERIKRIFIFF